MTSITPKLVEKLDAQLEADLRPDGRLGLPKRYLAGDHDLPYMPRGAKREYRALAETSITNWTPLISDTFGKALFVDGYRASGSQDEAGPWSYWQANGLDARQTIAHRGALDYGVSYVLVLPGDPDPVIRPLDPLKTLALYADDDDEWPEVAFRRVGKTDDDTQIVEVYDAQEIHTYTQKDSNPWRLVSSERHGLGVVPFVRFRERLSGENVGIIRPIIPVQNRINLTVFSTAIAMQYASFRQRWATGLAVPEDEDGNPVEPFQAAVDRLWVSDSPDTKFGDFAQTELSGHHMAYTAAVRTLAAVSQISPSVLTGDLINVSAEALASFQDTTQRKLNEYENLFGEAWEQVFRLAALAAGDTAAATDTSAEVRWRDTEARAMRETIEALALLAEKLSVPVEALWEKVPGTTQGEVDSWKALRPEDPLAGFAAEFSRQTGGLSVEQPAPSAPSAPSAPPAEA